MCYWALFILHISAHSLKVENFVMDIKGDLSTETCHATTGSLDFVDHTFWSACNDRHPAHTFSLRHSERFLDSASDIRAPLNRIVPSGQVLLFGSGDVDFWAETRLFHRFYRRDFDVVSSFCDAKEGFVGGGYCWECVHQLSATNYPHKAQMCQLPTMFRFMQQLTC